ncbi:Kynurenine 3-monooxygenase [Phycisphaerae bacterium RAS1]|nr:Kynurenine 3-monooxygenase [Phycisphaerae bacterium RAS1]
MPGAQEPRFSLIGGGLAGALMATYLGRRGYKVDLYERRADPHAGNLVGGRSINLAISTRGIHALQQVGLADEILKSAVPMRGRMIHSLDGGLHFQPYDKDPNCCINSIGRATLNSVTIAAARAMPNVAVHFNHRCTDVDLERPAARLINTETNETLESAGDVVLGVDGAFSAVRRSMQRLDRFDYSQHYLAHGYKELTIPPAEGGGFRMERNALHIWPRRSFMMIALPNFDGSYTCTLFFQHDGPLSFASLRTDADVRQFFITQFPDAVPLMPTLVEDFRANPTGAMMTVRCAPWNYQGKIVLLGDAAHAVVPFYGQGANASFEDCVALDECIRELAPDWPRVFGDYAGRRKPHADAIADLALKNFIEMRDKTASRAFRMYKRIDRTLHRALPGVYTPLYTMVSFSLVPYGDAVRRARRQDRVLAAVMAVVAALLLSVALFLALRGGWTLSATLAALLVGVAAWIIHQNGRSGREMLRSIGVRDP